MVDRQILLYRSWAPMRRLQAAAELYALAKEILRARERRLQPQRSPKEIERRVRELFR